MPGWDLDVHRKLRERPFQWGNFHREAFSWVLGLCGIWGQWEVPRVADWETKATKAEGKVWERLSQLCICGFCRENEHRSWGTPSVHDFNSSSSWIQIFHIHEGFGGCYMEKKEISLDLELLETLWEGRVGGSSPFCTGGGKQGKSTKNSLYPELWSNWNHSKAFKQEFKLS